jgi:hypothetical protein
LVAIPPRNATLFADAIVRLASSPQDRARFGEQGRAQVLDRFMIESNMAEAVRRITHMARRCRSTSDSRRHRRGSPSPR